MSLVIALKDWEKNDSCRVHVPGLLTALYLWTETVYILLVDEIWDADC